MTCRPGKAVEDPGDDQAQALERDFLVPAVPWTAEDAARQFVAQTVVVDLGGLGRRPVRVDVDRHAERLGAGEQRAEVRVVEEAPADGAVGHATHEAVVADGAFKFVGCGVGLPERERREGAGSGPDGRRRPRRRPTR